jgi:type I restriction enzyme S subunit
MSWKQTTLGQVADIVSGATPKSDVISYWDGPIAWATPTDLSQLDGKHISKTIRTISEDGLSACSTRLLPPGSVLFSSRAPIGLVAINTRPMATNQGFKSFVPKPELNADFLFWWLKSHRRQLEDLGNGATFKEVSKAVVSRVPFLLPPIMEQRRIAAILDKADDIRRKREHSLALVDDFLRSVFVEMFGDQERLDAYEELGGHLDFVTSGSRGWAQHYAERGARFIRSLDVQMNEISDAEVVYVNPPPSAEADRARVKIGDVLLTITGSRIGRVTDVTKLEGEAYISQHVAIIRTRKTLLPSFLSYFLSNDSLGQRQIENMQYGQTKPGLNLRQIRSFMLPVPGLDQQLRFEEILGKIRRHKGSYLQELAQSNDLFSSLSQRAFRGEL